MVEFYHYMFYKASNYYKDNDFPIYSPVMLMTFFLGFNYMAVHDLINYFMFHNRWFSKWEYWIPDIIIILFNYWYFSKDSRWKSVVKWGDKMSRQEKRERNIYYWIYVILTLLLFAVVFYITTENVFRIYPKHFTSPDNIHFIVR